LEREWRHPNDGSVEKGSKFSANVESILNVFLSTSENVLESLADYSKEMEDILEKKGGKDCKSDTIRTFTK
jgi:hypothetical protein